ncbi:MAG: thioredoxin family protein [Saprospiraceae bacterium]
MKALLERSLEAGMTYPAYFKLMTELVEAGKTTGPNQSETMAHYTKMNLQRMSRLDKKVALDPTLVEAFSAIPGEYVWLVITEAWCGDAAQIVPVFNALVGQLPQVELSLVLRDELPELMDQFLTNGSRAIPKLIILEKESLAVVDTWGARPAPAQVLVDAYKADPNRPPYAELSLSLQKWYNKDKNVTLQQELLQLAQRLGARLAPAT